MRQFSSKGFITLAMVAYCILASVYFIQHYCWDNIFGITIALPTLFATTLTAMRRRHGGWFIPLALLFSTLGDYAGSVDNFLMQVMFFAFAHIFFICDFLPHRKFSAIKAAAIAGIGIAAVGYLGFVCSHITEVSFSRAIMVYGLIIWLMGSAAILQNRQYRGWYIAAAMLFIFSDGVIAYGFVEQLPYSTALIMPTYYAAQAIFTVLYMLRQKGSN